VKKLLMSALLPLLCLIPLAASAQATPTMTFGPNWSVTLTGQPTAGGQLRIVYDLSRLSFCRAPSVGAWTLTGYAMTNRGPVQSFVVANDATVGTTAEVLLPLTTGGNLELWFQEAHVQGCSNWDSNLNWNHHAKVWQNPTLTFSDNWTQSLHGTLQGGTTLMVDYDIDRLGQCRGQYMNYETWGVWVEYRINGGPVLTHDLTVAWGEWNQEFRKGTPAFIPLPAGPGTLEMWFVNMDRKGCAAYDSRFGQNYVYTFQ
jgi:hypothetical protein